MSKKILEEATIRRFMKLASIGMPSQRFIKETFMTEQPEEEEELGVPPEGMPGEEELGVPPEGAPGEEELGVPEEELEAPEEEGEMALSDEEAAVLVSLGRKLQAAGVEGSEEGVEEVPGEEELEAPPEEVPGEEELEAPPEGVPGEEEEEEPVLEDIEDIEVMTEKEFDYVVNEVMKRVTKRILRGSIKKKK